MLLWNDSKSWDNYIFQVKQFGIQPVDIEGHRDSRLLQEKAVDFSTHGLLLGFGRLGSRWVHAVTSWSLCRSLVMSQKVRLTAAWHHGAHSSQRSFWSWPFLTKTQGNHGLSCDIRGEDWGRQLQGPVIFKKCDPNFFTHRKGRGCAGAWNIGTVPAPSWARNSTENLQPTLPSRPAR